MNTCILVGIDENISPQTSYALETVSKLVEQCTSQPRLALLHVIPVLYVSSPRWGKYRLQPTPQQRRQAENALRRASTVLQQRGIAPENIEVLQRSGIPAEEIIAAASELPADFIIVGSRGDPLKQQIRRFVVGSTSRQVLKHAPCPVVIAVPQRIPHPRCLVGWYKEEIAGYLQEHPDALMVFTPDEAAHMFVPRNAAVGHQEVDAAAIALARLSRDGVLSCWQIQGESRYVND